MPANWYRVCTKTETLQSGTENPSKCSILKRYEWIDTKVVWMRKLFVWTLAVLLHVAASPDLFGQSLSRDHVDVRPLSSTAGAATLYRFDFTLQDTLRPDGVIEVVFPEGFDLSRVVVAGSQSINGGFRVEVKGQTVVLRRQGRGAARRPGEKVDVMLATVRNPGRADVAQAIVLRTSGPAGKQARAFRGEIVVSPKRSASER